MENITNTVNNIDNITNENYTIPTNIIFNSIENNILNLLKQLGENPYREGLLNTPKRVSKALKYFTSGYNDNLNEIVNNAIFEEHNSGIIVVKNIDIFSMCEHHILPIIGKAHVGYIPDGKVIGLSKIPRICDMYSRRLQIQERLTEQIANAIQEILKPKGVMVLIESTHMCMMIRGVKKQGSTTTTQSALGYFKESKYQNDFFQQI